MKVYDVPYCAVVCYEYNGGERIVFKQESLSTKVAYLTGEKSPHVRSEYTMFKDGNQCHRWLSIKESIFDDIAINGYVGFYGKELGYDWIHIPKAYQSVRVVFCDKKCSVWAGQRGLVFKDIHNQEPMLTMPVLLFKDREEKSLYRVLMKILTEVGKIYEMEFDSREFI